MAANIETKSFDLRVHPDGTIPSFNTAADLLNAVLPSAYEVTVYEMGPVSFGLRPSYKLSPDSTHFFPDGIVSLATYDEDGYKKFIEGKEQSYLIQLRAVVSGVMVFVNYYTAIRPSAETAIK